MDDTTFGNKVVWITGASSGIGRALAQNLSERGARLILSSRRQKALEKAKAACDDCSEVHILPLDLSQTKTLEEKVEQALDIFGHIDYLFNNGGISQRSLALQTEMSVIRNVMEVNFFGTVALTKALVPAMIERGHGHVVVTSSITGKFGTRLRSAYASSKHALHGWFDSLRQEVYHQNIKITLVCPGFVKTNVTINALQGDGSPLGKMSPGQANGISPEECARQILEGILKGRCEIYIGGKEIWGVYMKRLAPRLFNKLLRNTDVT